MICFNIACGSGTVIQQITPTPEPAAPGDATSLNLTPQENLFVVASMNSDPVGSIATIGLNSPNPVQKSRAVTDGSDTIIKSYDSKLFVINRGQTSTIQVIDPDSFKIVGNYSVGPGSNPQDLVVVNGKAYISRLQPELDSKNKDDLWIVDPVNGKLKTSIDLKPFTDPNGAHLANATKMALVDDLLYLLLQDLDKNSKATTNGKVVIIDTKTDKVVPPAIQLAGRNPWDIVYSATLKKIFITDAGYFDAQFYNDVHTSYGGIEVIDPAINKSPKILMDDADFGGYVSVLKIFSDHLGVVTAGDTTLVTFDPEKMTILSLSLYKSPGPYIPDLVFDKNGLLWVPERNFSTAGLFLIDPQNGAKMGGPFTVGALPASMTLIK